MKVLQNSKGETYFSLNHGKRNVLTPEIRYIKSDGNYSCILLRTGEVLLSSFTLKVYADQLLKRPNFFVGKRGLLINLNYLKTLSEIDGVLYGVFKNGEELPLSRRKGKGLLMHLRRHRGFINRVY
ncbi:LytTR family transcriptional regulator DNA-binding domain-containing protein [uncultured Arcticibacterium sp.]|uniref:LytTR family transcriptional regulator DNA-binding domain-containing protein n=1 Tax=uncultured Arcticibacterium sp. TaxID=2173042 RepID=UPI0030F7B737